MVLALLVEATVVTQFYLLLLQPAVEEGLHSQAMVGQEALVVEVAALVELVLLEQRVKDTPVVMGPLQALLTAAVAVAQVRQAILMVVVTAAMALRHQLPAHP
jgi:hypothetical protein